MGFIGMGKEAFHNILGGGGYREDLNEKSKYFI